MSKRHRKPKYKFRRSLNRLLAKFGYSVESLNKPDMFSLLINKIYRHTEDFQFLQIGANDGVSFDPIYEFVTTNHVSGVVVEPLKDMFASLCYHYRNQPQIKPVNIAIHQHEKEITLYRTDPGASAELPNWTQGIASINSDHHKKSSTPSKYIVEEKVKCLTLDELLEQYNINSLTLLQIDTEGYDYEIIKGINFNRIKPTVIHFEHGNGVMSEEQLQEIIVLLRNEDYFLIPEEHDMIAFQSHSI